MPPYLRCMKIAALGSGEFSCVERVSLVRIVQNGPTAEKKFKTMFWVTFLMLGQRYHLNCETVCVCVCVCVQV